MISRLVSLYLDPLLELAFFGLLVLAGLRYWSGIGPGQLAMPGRHARAIRTAGLIVCGLLVLAALSYPFSVRYLDHVEPEIAAITWLGVRGLEYYPHLDGLKGLYGTVYGPLLFELNTLPLLISPTVFGSKVAGVLALCAGLFFQYRAVRNVSNTAALGIPLFLLSVLFVFHSNLVITNRAEPFLFLLSAVAAWMLRAKGPGAALTLGLIAGLASALKLHGLLYVLPTACALLAAQTTWRAGFLCLALGIADALAGFLAPFATAPATLSGFAEYNLMAMHHAFSGKLLILNLLFGSCLAAMAILALHWARPLLSRAETTFAISVTACFGVVALLASKTGAGAHHLLPYIPAVFTALGLVLSRARTRQTRMPPEVAANGLLLAALLTHGPIALHQAIGPAALLTSVSQDRERLNELLALHARYPDAEVGVTDNDNYRDTLWYPQLIFNGGTLRFDAAAWMDMQYAGLDERLALRLLEQCAVTHWILPRPGEPFSMPSWYTQEQLFSDTFRATFHRNYDHSVTGKFYSVWSCHTAQGHRND